MPGQAMRQTGRETMNKKNNMLPPLRLSGEAGGLPVGSGTDHKFFSKKEDNAWFF